MRKILFRGKRTDNGEWVYGDYSRGKRVVFIGTVRGDLALVIPETVGQYTGLTDKNGTRIFEGDIVRFGSGINGLVTYDEGQYILKYGNNEDDWEPLCGWYEETKVIGNIHDNPELLEVENE